ncbi:MAG: RNA-binding protein, partial [Fimbriimonadaceae bacterium]
MSKRLYVGNLPYSASEADLFDHFKDFNPQTARIIEGRGFGFVDVEDETMDAAIEAMHNSTFGGRRLVVNEARPKPEGTGGGGGGRGSYGGGGGGRSGGGFGGGRGGGR